ncbi:DUF4339 domain-containing protein [Mesorhizobium sp. M2D.F.Ca.ET.223.01.1.1]|uniref:DUF4339 domain-containing protein n=1 Tax=unclassified Mesorhizobium TaxID=325217 RepID=UPI000FCCB9D4|nr:MULTISPECIES: DUF4339 domain-containing protein [unclassified Mesorhizobium]TGP89323.1 DUF4339 domain-containing protein [bacterium M00.F.Ca.ET.221.01.1.1]TGP94696.1 DUF4339 domain-containing protein [bacterium M00.F.Ca.ET.222.01.1.1]RVD58890.1 DUF4339 domain-containing protein [Mesorhizobium sp. M2D.F.Ca.ET.140.01.1.1]TGP27919.1 DUF4339 domain-containing protein [Mesorhizobium sp. M2D.F.Ca.ET.232.01.1.1]TGP75864.1 DUF4339 domain-containing protein [Mesorhizobium sp. M2D.F.Ca.ET.224.01.1.1]
MNKQQSAAINYRETGAFVWALITYPIIWFLLVLLGISFTAKLLGYPLEKGNRVVLFVSLGAAVLAGLYVIFKRMELHFARREAVRALPPAPPGAPTVTAPEVPLVTAPDAPVAAAVEAPVETPAAKAPPEIPRSEWFYVTQGQKSGPVPWSVIRDLRQRGSIEPDTLVWSELLGNAWKPLSALDLQTSAVLDSSPPLPPEVKKPYPASALVWLITLSPILIYIAERILENAGYNIDPKSSFIIATFSILILSSIDAGLVRKSGRDVAVGWIVLVPGYLIARARALSEPMYHFAIWTVAFVGCLYLTSPGIFDGTLYWGTGLPECNGKYLKTQVTRLMNENAPLVSFYGNIIDVSSAVETGKTETTRKCMLSVLGSNATFSAEVTLENKDDKILILYQPL